MTLSNIALLGLMRQKGKKLFVILAMALGCATVVSLFTFVDTQKNTIERQLDEYGANIVILPKSDDLGLTYGGITVSGAVANLEEISLTDIDRIWEIPNRDNIRAVSPKLLGAVEVKGRQDLITQVLLVGVYFREELKIKSWWELSGAPPARPDEVIAGSDVALRLDLSLGNSIIVGDRKLRVSGILGPTGSQDDSIMFADFDMVSSLLGRSGIVSLAEVSALCSDCPIETIVSQLEGILPDADIKQVRQMMQQKMQTIGQFEKFAMTVTLVIVAIGGLLVFLSMMGAIAERKQEIGIFRAVGFTRVHIATVILTEALILSTAAGLLGTAAGLLITSLALPNLLDIDRELLVISPAVAAAGITGVILIGIVATFYPALRASKIDPVIAINSL